MRMSGRSGGSFAETATAAEPAGDVNGVVGGGSAHEADGGGAVKPGGIQVTIGI